MSSPLFRSPRDGQKKSSPRGFSLLELVIVMGIGITVAAMAVPTFLTAYYDLRLKAACSDLSGLMQKARIQAARQNGTYTVQYRTATVQEAFVDMNANSTWDSSVTINGNTGPEPLIDFNQAITMATGAPSGSGGQPTPYVLVGDTAGTTYTNTTTLGWSARGLPCAYSSGVCTTPAAGYFVYYVKDARPTSTGWGAVVVTRSGRTKVAIWNGAAWQ